jgi:NADPH-dependent glutamate synthase beta subunit-like oxidoreductase
LDRVPALEPSAVLNWPISEGQRAKSRRARRSGAHSLSRADVGTDFTLTELGVALDKRGNVEADTNRYASSPAEASACGDMRRGQSLVVWAIREGRQCAAAIHEALMGSTVLPR